MRLRSISRRNEVKRSNKRETAVNTRDRNRAAQTEKSISEERLRRTKKPTTNGITRGISRKAAAKKERTLATRIRSVEPKSVCTRSGKVLVSSKKSLDDRRREVSDDLLPACLLTESARLKRIKKMDEEVVRKWAINQSVCSEKATKVDRSERRDTRAKTNTVEQTNTSHRIVEPKMKSSIYFEVQRPNLQQKKHNWEKWRIPIENGCVLKLTFNQESNQ